MSLAQHFILRWTPIHPRSNSKNIHHWLERRSCWFSRLSNLISRKNPHIQLQVIILQEICPAVQGLTQYGLKQLWVQSPLCFVSGTVLQVYSLQHQAKSPSSAIYPHVWLYTFGFWHWIKTLHWMHKNSGKFEGVFVVPQCCLWCNCSCFEQSIMVYSSCLAVVFIWWPYNTGVEMAVRF